MKKICLFLTSLLACSALWANNLPAIKIIVPYPVGGPGDTLGRIVQQSLIKELNVAVVVENRPGGGATIGTVHALNNTKDPTLILHNTSIVFSTFKNPQPYSEKQLIPVTYLGRVPWILVAKNKFDVYNLSTLRNYNKPIMFGTAGIATAGHMAMENLNMTLKRDLVMVPYKGNAPIVTDLIGGHVDMSFLMATVANLAHIQNKDFVAIAVDSNSRLPVLKNVPTFEETGIKLQSNLNWFALFRGGVWQENQLQQVQTAMVRIMSDPKLSQPYRDFGLIWNQSETLPSANFVEKERQSLAPMVKKIPLE